MFKSIDFLTGKDGTPYGRRGFTLVEPLLIMGIMAILGGAAVSQLNPGKQYTAARNSQRRSNVSVIAAAVRERTDDMNGAFGVGCPAGPIPTSSVRMAKEKYDIAPCLVPEYLSALPYDPSDSDAHYESVGDYDTGYTVSQSATGGIITVTASHAELGEMISAAR